MTILKDLLALQADKPAERIAEGRTTRGGFDMDDLLDKWSDANKAYSWEGPRGVRNLTKLVRELDSNYRDLDSFFEDNSGAVEAILEWIKSANVNEWGQNLKDNYGGDEETVDDGDDDNK